jgi:hypothetical protein
MEHNEENHTGAKQKQMKWIQANVVLFTEKA